MYRVDIHANKETVDAAITELKIAIGIAKKDKDRLLKVVTGYGSNKGSTHKIKTAVIEFLNENKGGLIKDFLLGSDLDIFNVNYQNFKYKDRIPLVDKKQNNPGCIYIGV